jgi:hypothetical protein
VFVIAYLWWQWPEVTRQTLLRLLAEGKHEAALARVSFPTGWSLKSQSPDAAIRVEDNGPHRKIGMPAIRMIRPWCCCFEDAKTRELPRTVVDLTLARRRYECEVIVEYEPVHENGILYGMSPFPQTIEFAVERGTVYIRGIKL